MDYAHLFEENLALIDGVILDRLRPRSLSSQGSAVNVVMTFNQAAAQQ